MGNQSAEALGSSRGGFPAKVHARCESRGRSFGLILPGREACESHAFLALFLPVKNKTRAPIADKGHAAEAIRAKLIFSGIEPVVPPESNRREAIPLDSGVRRKCNLIEWTFDKLMDWQRGAIRYDKSALSFLSFFQLVAVRFWRLLVNRV